MGKISSNQEHVNKMMDSIQTALSPLDKEVDLNIDIDTTLSGNAVAHTLYDNYSTQLSVFITHINKDVDNVKSIAESFKTIDENMSKEIG